MNENTNKLAALASLAHRALGGEWTEYARAKALISQFFAPSCAAYSLLSKYLYFATGFAFPIYDNLGANYFYLAGELNNPDFTARFRTLQKIMRENAVDGFDRLDNFFWLYGKVETRSFSLVLNKERYAALAAYPGDAVNDIRAGSGGAALQNIFGPGLAAFIQQSAAPVF